MQRGVVLNEKRENEKVCVSKKERKERQRREEKE
jgi:hypothetical protein